MTRALRINAEQTKAPRFSADVTFVYNDQRVIYNAGATYAGSASTTLQIYSGPTATLCGYGFELSADDQFLGAKDAKT